MLLADADGFEITILMGKIAAGCLIGALVLLILKKLFLGGGKKKKVKVKRTNLQENLEEYPDAPPSASGRRLLVDGLEVRIRLVVVAQPGTQRAVIQADDVADLLDDFVRGLGGFVNTDKPRVRIWPPQLSAGGFAPTFFRHVASPDPAGQRSHWIRLAGTIKIAGEPYLLGLVLWSEDATKIGALDLAPNKWGDHLKIER